MPANSIVVRLTPSSKDSVCYRICNRIIETNRRIEILSAFELEHDGLSNADSVIDLVDVDRLTAKDNAGLIFEGQSWLAGKDRAIVCTKYDDDYFIDVPDVARFQIFSNLPGIHQLGERNKNISQAEFEEVLLGPPLMLTLAKLQLFALHASAVKVNDKAVLFVGESGFGKSTLACWLDEQTPLTRLSDDISVLERVDSHYRLQPDFLQMKLASHHQQVNAKSIELAAVVLLNRSSGATASLDQLDTLESIKTLVNHSVAAQLFDKPLAQQHLEFLSNLSQKRPIYKLNYPDGQDCMTTIAKILTNQLH